MKCIYCGSKTRVINSRHTSRSNSVWRRRACLKCNSIVSTQEEISRGGALSVSKKGHLEPFSRDKLFLSIYQSLGHRKSAQPDATALTGTIIAAIEPQNTQGSIDSSVLTETACSVLKRFDKAAATHYEAYHLSS